MAGEVRQLVLQAAGRKVMHIGGWEHLLELPGGRSLYDLLKDLRPRRVLLPDAARAERDAGFDQGGKNLRARGPQFYAQNLWKSCGKVLESNT